MSKIYCNQLVKRINYESFLSTVSQLWVPKLNLNNTWIVKPPKPEPEVKSDDDFKLTLAHNNEQYLSHGTKMKTAAKEKLAKINDNIKKYKVPRTVYHHPTDLIIDSKVNGDKFYPTLHLPVELNVQQTIKMTNTFGFYYTFSSGEPHDHPYSAASRWVSQMLVEKEIQKRLQFLKLPVLYSDIFGSARLPNESKHCCMPIITATDYLRVRPNTNCCNCDVEECVHIKNTSVTFSVDALYYMNPQQISNLCAKTAAKEHHVLFHRMLKHSGVSNNGEYRWTTYEHEGKLFNKVLIGQPDTGNVYNSPIMEWLNQRTWLTSNGYLHYVFKKNLGDMEYGVFILTQKELVNPSVELNPETINLISWTLNTPEPFQSMFGKIKNWVNFNLGDITGWQHRYLITEFRVPVELYCILTQVAMYVPEDKRDTLLGELKSRAIRWKNENRSKFEIDEKQFTQYLPHVIAAALTASLPAEFGALHSQYVNDFCVQNPGLWRKSYSRVKRVMVSLSSVLLAYSAFTVSQPKFSVALGVVGAIISAAAMYGASKKNVACHGKYIYQPLTCQMMDIDDFYGFLKTFDTDHCLQHTDLEDIAELTQHMKSQIIRTAGKDFLRVSATIVNKMNFNCECKVKELRKPGVCMFMRNPSLEVQSFVNCSCNMYSALTQRYFKSKSTCDVDLWKAAAPVLLRLSNKFIDTELCTDYYYPKWFSGLLPHKRELVKKALLSQKIDHYHRSKPSVKQEIVLKWIGSDGRFKHGKPRNFFVKDPLHYSETGPDMYAFKEMLRRNMNGINTPFLFGCGYTPVQLGDTLKRGLDKWLPDAERRRAYECDLATCEATMKGYCLALESTIMYNAGVAEKTLTALYDKARCYCDYKLGTVTFSMSNCRESGSSYTSVGNTITYATLLDYCLVKNKVKNFFVLIGGDDSVVYFNKGDESKVRDAFAMLTRFGLLPEYKYRDYWYAARFYSGFFAPYQRSDHTEGLTHIPSLGKAFMKSWSFRMREGLTPEIWLSETSKQKGIIWSHIPLLRMIKPLADRILDGKIIGKTPKNFTLDCGGFLYKEWKHDKITVTGDTTQVINHVYGLTSTCINSLEENLKNTLKGDWSGSTYINEILDHLLKEDLS